MTLIQVINPNTSRAMTSAIGRTAREVAGPGVRVLAVTSSMGPASIESHYDEALAVPGLLAAVRDGELAGADGHVIACFGDPGLAAAREIATGPVVGIAEAAMHVATYLGRSFSVVTTLSRTVGHAGDLVRGYGFSRACAGVHACDIPVLDLESVDARSSIAKACAAARDADGCDVIVLGCAGMTDLAASISGELGIPVVDGVAAAVKTVESLVALGLRTSKRDEYALPPAKPVSGLLSGFTLLNLPFLLLRRRRTGQVIRVGPADSRQRREVMSQKTARHDPHADSGDEDVAAPQARQPESKPGVRPRQPVGRPAGDGGVSPVEPDEPDEGGFELIGDDDLSAADLGPAAPNVTDPDAGSGRVRKITGKAPIVRRLPPGEHARCVGRPSS